MAEGDRESKVSHREMCLLQRENNISVTVQVIHCQKMINPQCDIQWNHSNLDTNGQLSVPVGELKASLFQRSQNIIMWKGRQCPVY